MAGLNRNALRSYTDEELVRYADRDDPVIDELCRRMEGHIDHKWIDAAAPEHIEPDARIAHEPKAVYLAAKVEPEHIEPDRPWPRK